MATTVPDALATDYIHGRQLQYYYETDTTQRLYRVYSDYYDGTPTTVERYFTQRHRETPERFADRPKIVWPLCRTLVDLHAEALVKGSKLVIDDPATQEEWDRMADHNAWDAYKQRLATTIGTFGSAGVKPIVHDDGTEPGQIEWEFHSPGSMRFLYESTGIGRSVKRILGAVIESVYIVESNSIEHITNIESARTVYGTDKAKRRTEIITNKRWEVYLDSELTPISPHGDIWMPTDNGINPYGIMPVALYNGKETHESFLGISDIHHSVHDNQTVNEIFSDVVYMHRLYVPVAVLKSINKDTREAFKTGIGVGWALDQGDDFTWANAAVDWNGVLEPQRIALELFYSNGKAPATAVGLGHLFGDQQRVSGKAKEFEYKPTISHARDKQPAFARGWIDMARVALTIAAAPPPFGQGKPVNPKARMHVEYTEEIIPVSKAEEMERITAEIVGGVKSIYTSMIEYHKWTPERAAEEMDRLAVEQRRTLVDAGYKDIEKIIRRRQETGKSLEELRATEEELFKPTAPMESDRLALMEEGAPTGGNEA